MGLGVYNARKWGARFRAGISYGNFDVGASAKPYLYGKFLDSLRESRQNTC